MTIFIVLCALIIIAALGYYAWHLTRQVKIQQARQLEEQQKAEQALRDQQQGLIKDIRFLCSSVLTEQCEITEGVMRIHYLVNGLDPQSWQHDNLATLRNFHAEVADMPILDDYKKLKPRQQFELDKRRLELEEQHKDDIKRELKWLVTHDFPTVLLIH